MEQQISNAAEIQGGAFGVKFIDPQTVIAQLEIKSGMKIADFGCGAGFFSLALAQKIGKEGIVYAFDVLPEKLETVQSQAKNLGLTNILTKRANLELDHGSNLQEGSMDWVIIKDMLFQNTHKEKIIIEAKRVLNNAGKILAIEWKVEDTSIGPGKELRISKENLIELAQQNGLGVLNKVEVGDFHYGLILIK